MGDLSAVDARTLRALDRPRKLYQLAEDLCVPVYAVEGVCLRLEKAGLVQRVQIGSTPVTHWVAIP